MKREQRPALAAYLTGASVVLVSQAAGVVAGFASFWLLARILSKEMFGGYVFAMAVVMLVATIATLGLDRSLLLRIAALRERADYLHGGGLAARTALSTLVAAGLMAAALVFGAERIVALGAHVEAAFWLPALAAALPAMAVTLLMQAWFKANHRVAVAVAVPGSMDILRALLLGLVFALGLGAVGVAAAVALAAALPAAVLVVLAWGRTRASPRRLTAAEFGKGAGFLTMRLSTEGMRKLDLVLMGLLAAATGTAEYAVAARLAVLADYARTALKPSFTPRARRWLSLGDGASARREYDGLRHMALAFAIATAAGFVLLGEPILRFFGPFEDAYAPLLLLVASHLLNAGFGMHFTYLAMAGEIGWSTVVRIAGLGLFVLLNLVLIPRHGALGAAAAMLVVQGFMNVTGAMLARRLTGLVAVDAGVLLVIGLAIGALVLVAAAAVPPVAGACVLLLALVAPLLQSRGPIGRVAGLMRRRLALALGRGEAP